MSAFRSENTDDIEYYRKRIDASLKDIEYLQRSYKDMVERNESTTQGHFSVRLLSYAPSFGIAKFDLSKTQKKLVVEVYPHHSGYGHPPIFSLTPQRDCEWFDYFENQFSEMWKAATPWELDTKLDSDNRIIQYMKRKATSEDFFLSENLISDKTFASANTIYLSGMTLILGCLKPRLSFPRFLA
jgi:hypothetical protein